jgi:23S rRNA (cytosine1962-C5)-methyltransferase
MLDYQLIDSGEYERLERFGKFYVVRPEPNALWGRTNTNHVGWKSPDARFEKKWSFSQASLDDGFEISRGNHTFFLKPTSFRHLGIFPEQEPQWESISDFIKHASKPVKLLNLFAYTGVLSVLAAAEGADVTHVDASKSSVVWAAKNAQLNNITTVRWIIEDVRKFVEREVRRGSTYDVICLDPPVFGRGAKGEIWRLEEELSGLLSQLKKISHKETMVVANIYATATYPESFKRVMEEIFDAKGRVILTPTLLTESDGKSQLQTGYSLVIKN